MPQSPHPVTSIVMAHCREKKAGLKSTNLEREPDLVPIYENVQADCGLDENEGRAIYHVITEHQLSNTLEVGCAFGISSLYICAALSKQASPRHTIIDPNQTTDWQGIGVQNLQRSGYHYFSLIEKPSEIALPELLAENKKFQFILIDGWHTFDHTLLDFFYANKLLEEGGFVAIDDASWPGIRKVISYISKYPNFQIYKTVNVEPDFRMSEISTDAVDLSADRRYRTRARNGIRRLMDSLFRFAAKSLPKNYSSEVFKDQYCNSGLHWRSYGTMVIFRKTGPDRRDFQWFEPF